VANFSDAIQFETRERASAVQLTKRTPTTFLDSLSHTIRAETSTFWLDMGNCKRMSMG
jgi:hypothetical protein